MGGPHLVMDGGYSIQSWVGGVPGVPPILTWDLTWTGGTLGTPYPDLGVDILPFRPGMRYPHPDLGWGIPPSRSRNRVPPPRKCGQTYTCDNSTFPRTLYAVGNNFNNLSINVTLSFLGEHCLLQTMPTLDFHRPVILKAFGFCKGYVHTF